MTNTILTPADVQRIGQEEALRAEIRDVLDTKAPKPKTPWAKFWVGLNSTFGIWLLTAVFVTGLGSLVSHWYEEAREKQEKHEKELVEKAKKEEARLAEEARKRETDALLERQRKETYERISLEIGHRFSDALSGLEDVSRRFGKRKGRNVHRAIVRALRPLTRPASSEQPPLFKDYEAFSGLALIVELRRHAGRAEADRLKEILGRTSNFLHEVTSEGSGRNFAARAAATDLIRAMHHSEWQHGFAFTDCTPDNPFC